MVNAAKYFMASFEGTPVVTAAITVSFDRDNEQWSRGAYAWFRPGEMTSLLRHIASPEGRIHFAGDHTSPAPGWMNGALQSGNRVAREVADRQN